MKKKIKRLDDGDSGVFTDGTRFRLAGVGAPEMYQFGGSKAKRALAGMIGRSNGYVEVTPVGSSYGRKVVTMRNHEGGINERMRRRGYIAKGR